MQKKTLALFLVLSLFYSGYHAFAQKKSDCRSRELIIQAAQLDNQAYAYAKMSYLVNNKSLSLKNADSAQFYFSQAIMCIDSALLLASDSELMAIDYSNLAKKFTNRSLRLAKTFTDHAASGLRKDLVKQSVFYAANAVTDAYHASFYFKKCEKKESPKLTPERKDSLPGIGVTQKEPTKLDIDQTLFAMLDGHLQQKTEEGKKELNRLLEELKNTKDPAKAEKIKAEIKRIEKENEDLILRDKNAKEKLTELNSQIDARNKNNNNETKPEETVFSKSMKRPADEWDKQVVMDAELPMGLVYQVQIGFYKNLNISEIFRGLTPIMGKTMPGGGISYSIGMFEKAADAQQAKTYVKSIGLTDAFVVASYNRKKITIAEAMKLEKK